MFNQRSSGLVEEVLRMSRPEVDDSLADVNRLPFVTVSCFTSGMR